MSPTRLPLDPSDTMPPSQDNDTPPAGSGGAKGPTVCTVFTDDHLRAAIPVYRDDASVMINHDYPWRLPRGGKLVERWVQSLQRTLTVNNAFYAAYKAYHEGRMTHEELAEVDDALARAFRDVHQERLTPPIVEHMLNEMANREAATRVREIWDMAWERFREAPGVQEAIWVHGRLRVALMVAARRGQIGMDALSAGEVMLDVLLLQRGAKDDLDCAEVYRGPGETRAEILSRWDQNAQVRFETALRAVLEPDHVLDHIQGSAVHDILSVAASRPAPEAVLRTE